MHYVRVHIQIEPLMTVSTSPIGGASNSNSKRCIKCGTITKSGRRSCCAQGGAWFKDCGDIGDKKFGHTWAEGIKACNGFATSNIVKSLLQITDEKKPKMTVLRNDTLEQISIHRRGGRSHARTCQNLCFTYHFTIANTLLLFLR